MAEPRRVGRRPELPSGIDPAGARRKPAYPRVPEPAHLARGRGALAVAEGDDHAGLIEDREDGAHNVFIIDIIK